jgi:hypothetical protein
MVATLQQSGTAPMESSGEAEGLGPAESGQTLEQAERTPAAGATDTDTTPETRDRPADAGAAEEDRLLSTEEIAHLSPELQKHARALQKRLLASYNKRMAQVGKSKEYAEFGERFATDPEYRQAVLRQHGQPAQPSPAPQPPGPVQVPPQYVEMRRRTLPAEMQWMAESLAQGDYQRDLAMHQQFIRPMQEQYQQSQQAVLRREWEGISAEFSEKNPGWEQHEEEMTELVTWLKDASLKHPKFGNKLEALYKLRAILSGEDLETKAVQEQIERTAKAARNKSVSSTGGRGTQSNLEDRIRDPKVSSREAWRIATQEFRGR